jgi:hypothetical protein
MPERPNHRPPFSEFFVLKVTPEGKIAREISVSDLLARNDLWGFFYMSATEDSSTEVTGDTLHLNDVEIFPSHLRPGVFERGDIMISLRNVNAVLVFNPDTLRIKYLTVGKVIRQHDPDFIDGETISIFDNHNIGPEYQGVQSRIVLMSAKVDHFKVVYSGSATQPFFTDIMGKHQWLPNGNILITEATKGRAFEINAQGALVWEYFNLVAESRLALLDEAQRLPAGFTTAFFTEKRRNCGQSQSAGVSIVR